MNVLGYTYALNIFKFLYIFHAMLGSESSFVGVVFYLCRK
jgi:hypothetical protein